MERALVYASLYTKFYPQKSRMSLKLNHERHPEEVAQGLHDKKRGGGRGKGGGKKKADQENRLFD
jgi:hypothetical protein